MPPPRGERRTFGRPVTHQEQADACPPCLPGGGASAEGGGAPPGAVDAAGGPPAGWPAAGGVCCAFAPMDANDRVAATTPATASGRILFMAPSIVAFGDRDLAVCSPGVVAAVGGLARPDLVPRRSNASRSRSVGTICVSVQYDVRVPVKLPFSNSLFTGAPPPQDGANTCRSHCRGAGPSMPLADIAGTSATAGRRCGSAPATGLVWMMLPSR